MAVPAAIELLGAVEPRFDEVLTPGALEFVAELPKTLTGKIRRVELRERETRG